MILIMFLCWALTSLARGTAHLVAWLRPRHLQLVDQDAVAQELVTETLAA